MYKELLRVQQPIMSATLFFGFENGSPFIYNVSFMVSNTNPPKYSASIESKPYGVAKGDVGEIAEMFKSNDTRQQDIKEAMVKMIKIEEKYPGKLVGEPIDIIGL